MHFTKNLDIYIRGTEVRLQVPVYWVFDHCKEIGGAGIPAFVFEDGHVSIDPADAGLIEYGAEAACST